MEKRISERIYDLYELREDPIRNLDKIIPILDERKDQHQVGRDVILSNK